MLYFNVKSIQFTEEFFHLVFLFLLICVEMIQVVMNMQWKWQKFGLKWFHGLLQ
jgi:hypothetical protein